MYSFPLTFRVPILHRAQTGMPAFAGNGCLWTRGCGAPGGVIGIRTEIRNVQDR